MLETLTIILTLMLFIFSVILFHSTYEAFKIKWYAMGVLALCFAVLLLYPSIFGAIVLINGA